jgi:hypothetical protein
MSILTVLSGLVCWSLFVHFEKLGPNRLALQLTLRLFLEHFRKQKHSASVETSIVFGTRSAQLTRLTSIDCKYSDYFLGFHLNFDFDKLNLLN